MKRAIIFGGAFNPPSRGHVWIVGECAKIARQTGAEIWILPSGERHDKRIGISKDMRIKLSQAMIDDADTRGVTVRIVTTELDRDVLVETIDTVRQFEQQYADYQLSWVFGADAYLSMSTWRGGAWLLDHLDLLVVTRNDYRVQPRLRLRVIEGMHRDVSSTQIRQAHKEHRRLTSMVTPQVGRLLEMSNIRYT